jgi:hypothetical protein
LPGIGFDQPGQQTQQGGFACPARPKDGHDFAFATGKFQLKQKIAVGFAQIPYLKPRHNRSHSGCPRIFRLVASFPARSPFGQGEG